MIIFCGHFPDGAQVFTEAQVAGETRGGWYVRQLLGSCNIEGGPLFHVLSGNLSHQIEHHLFPDMPSNRYPEVAPRVRGAVRAVRPPVQHRLAHASVRHDDAEDLPPRASDTDPALRHDDPSPSDGRRPSTDDPRGLTIDELAAAVARAEPHDPLLPVARRADDARRSAAASPTTASRTSSASSSSRSSRTAGCASTRSAI